MDKAQILYGAAYSLYEQGDYSAAIPLFTELLLSHPFCIHYWKGLASAEQMNKNYTAALHAWCLVVLLDNQNPKPHFHAAECYLSLNQTEDALKALDAAEKHLNLESSEDHHLKTQIDLLKASMGGCATYV